MVQRDERTVAVENAGYRWVYFLVTYALLVDVMYRSLIRHEAAWDLMGLVVASGIFCAAYQYRRQTLLHGWAVKVLLALVLAAIAALIATLALPHGIVGN
jgi:hypothetical protein